MKTLQNTGVFWFRYDQRLHDNLAFFRLCAEVDHLIPVFVIDPRWFKSQRLHCRHMGQHRLHFLMQSLTELQASLREKGSDLWLLRGAPEVVLCQLLKDHNISKLGTSRYPGVYEKQELQAIQTACPQLEIISEETFTLFRQEQLPFELTTLPNHFTPFRKKVEPIAIDPPAKAPEWLPPPPSTAAPVPAVKEVLSEFVTDSIVTENTLFQGGRKAAMQRLQYYTTDSRKLLQYKQTRNGLLAFDDSSKLSSWLAFGNLSAREVYWQIKKFEQDVQANDSTYWLYFELLWREYFQWYLHKHHKQCFTLSGIKGKAPLTSYWPERFEKWRSGNTPWPIINACMRQLARTGYLSNRGRQLVASCLVHELNLDWRYGAAWFEETLVDYDVASNWGNWQYLAGVGADPRGHRKFDLEKQTRQYDPQRAFIRHWVSDNESEQLASTPLDSTDLVDWPIA